MAVFAETAPAAGDKSFEIALRKPSTAGPLGSNSAQQHSDKIIQAVLLQTGCA